MDSAFHLHPFIIQTKIFFMNKKHLLITVVLVLISFEFGYKFESLKASLTGKGPGYSGNAQRQLRPRVAMLPTGKSNKPPFLKRNLPGW